jgi:hypothetical protein
LSNKKIGEIIFLAHRAAPIFGAEIIPVITALSDNPLVRSGFLVAAISAVVLGFRMVMVAPIILGQPSIIYVYVVYVVYVNAFCFLNSPINLAKSAESNNCIPVGFGRVTCPCAANTRLFRLVNTESDALRTPPPLAAPRGFAAP